MRLSSFRYLVKEGFRNIWTNRMMSLASIGVLVACLLLIGSSLLFSLNINSAFNWVEDQNIIMVFIGDKNDDEKQIIENKIKSIDNVKECKFISKDEGLQNQKDMMGSEAHLLDGLDENPLPDSYEITLNNLGEIGTTVEQIKAIDGVDTVRENRQIAEKVTSVKNIVSNVSVWLILILLLVSLFIISNTVKITVYVRRLEISIMKSVGATDGFVRFPFMVEGAIIGLLAGGISYGAIYGLYLKVSSIVYSSLSVNLMNFGTVNWYVLGGFLVIGFIAGCIGSAITVRKYLKSEGGIYSVY